MSGDISREQEDYEILERGKMNRTLTAERVYVLGQYKTLRLTDSISNIPQELMNNKEFIDAVRLLQLMSLDRVYYTYVDNSPTYNEKLTSEERNEILDKASVSSTEKIKKTFDSLKGEESAE
jgi:hypothetical protein